MRSLCVRYLLDPAGHAASNRRGDNCWQAYLPEIMDLLGITAEPVTPGGLPEVLTPDVTGVLVLGAAVGDRLDDVSRRAIGDWISGGGVLIATGTRGLDDVLGVAGAGMVNQEPDDPFGITAYLRLLPGRFTSGCLAGLHTPTATLPIVSPVRLLQLTEAEELATAWAAAKGCEQDPDRARTPIGPGVTHRALASGHAFYFGFDLCQCMWAIQQGRPVVGDHDGDGYLRTPDACVIGHRNQDLPCTDILGQLLLNMIGVRRVPRVHPVPPRDGRAAPALLFFGGDDEAESGNQVPASDFMAARGFPYHINVMLRADGKFGLTASDVRRLAANGHEIALHYNLVDGFRHPTGFSASDLSLQASSFRGVFGRDSVCTAMHWHRWYGWADTARWLLQAGGQADNSFLGVAAPPMSQVNTLGFAFGSGCPRFFVDDAVHGNARVSFLELPISAYELTVGDPSGTGANDAAETVLARSLELAIRRRTVLDYFWHPGRIVRNYGCRRAIDQLRDLLRDLRVPPVMMGPDALNTWWRNRAETRISDASGTGPQVSFAVTCPHPEGFVAELHPGNWRAVACALDGNPADFEFLIENGRARVLVPVPNGRHRVTLTMTPAEQLARKDSARHGQESRSGT